MAQLHSLNFESFRLSEVIPNYLGIFCYRYTVGVSVMINVAAIFKVKRELQDQAKLIVIEIVRIKKA